MVPSTAFHPHPAPFSSTAWAVLLFLKTSITLSPHSLLAYCFPSRAFSSPDIYIIPFLTFLGPCSDFPLPEMASLSPLYEVPTSPVSNSTRLYPTHSHAPQALCIYLLTCSLSASKTGNFFSFVLCIIVQMPKIVSGMWCVSPKCTE